MRLYYILFILSLYLPLSYGLPIMGKRTLYDENEARVLVNLAAAAYGDQHQACLNKSFPAHENRAILDTQKEDCDSLGNTCEGYVVLSPVAKELIIVFRGTKTKAQLLLEGWDSLQPGADFFGMGNVNRYFLNAHLVLWPEIEQILTNTEYKDHRVTFTGHSLGGALASLAAARTAKQGYRPGNMIKIITFGQPRVGSLEYARNFDNMIYYSFRIVFRRDIVPHLPACLKNNTNGLDDGTAKPCDTADLNHAYHHGTEIWYPDDMSHGANYVECTGLPKNEDMKCSDRIKFFPDQSNSYIWDHRHYFQVRVPEYGKAGCDEKLPEGKPGFFEKAVVPLEVLNRTPTPPPSLSTINTLSIIAILPLLFYLILL
ncbi:hypothetical protein WR25_07040 isoform J [Diploscapter pachys]|uniref:Fungal lipase-type domain-containing protein n=2 Tax=Diploscapter pachys TaxID=2018661 RepID=A0A2A2JSB7_9BILA|nr:hypothetical protein WR25_07040 isoform J [Diploscapter pachys]